MSYTEQYRPPGRSNRSGRTNADNDVFEGLPVKQWGHQLSRVSLAPPVAEAQPGPDDKWGEPPMPRDYQLLNPWTQHLLRLARSGKVGTKRKQESDPLDDEKLEEEAATEDVNAKTSVDERAYVAKKWKPVPEHQLVQEHKHFEFLAKRRKGLPSLYAPDQQNGAVVSMRKTKVQRADISSGETVVYEVLVPEGQHVDGEVLESTELADAKPITAAPGTVIEGVGIANDEGVLVAEHLKPAVAPRRNRPPPKKKGGPGRGKKRVTFTNPDGSTYTTIVPNATKIVPQPGQIVKHVAKGEEAGADVSVEEAAQRQTSQPHEGGEDEGSDDGDDDGDDDDDREDGEMSDEDAPGTGAATPAKPDTPAKASTSAPLAEESVPQPMEDVQPSSEAVADHEKLNEAAAPEQPPEPEQPIDSTSQPAPAEPAPPKDASSSPEVALAKSNSRSGSLADPPAVSLEEQKEEPSEAATVNEEQSKDVAEPAIEATEAAPTDPVPPIEAVAPTTEEMEKPPAEAAEQTVEKIEEKQETAPETAAEPEAPGSKPDDGGEDLLGSLEKHLGNEKTEES